MWGERIGFLSQFEFNKSEYDDGSGFCDTYEGKTSWLGNNVQVSIAARSVSDEIALLYEKVTANQEKYDTLWKEFAVNELSSEMRFESNDESLTKQQILHELKVSVLTFGFDRDGLMSVWFTPPEPFHGHTALLYCDNNGNPLVAVMEG